MPVTKPARNTHRVRCDGKLATMQQAGHRARLASRARKKPNLSPEERERLANYSYGRPTGAATEF